MTWGRQTDEYEARDQLAAFLDVGGTLIDTADSYAKGVSEEMLGMLIQEFDCRADIVLATKAVQRPDTERRLDASRGHLVSALDASLKRLDVDHVDLWQLHRWDSWTPIEETLSAVDHALRSGKARYVGVSNYTGWQTARACTLQESRGVAPFVTTQMEYSLLERGIEREIVPAAPSLGIGILPWSPLGRGVLTGKYRTPSLSILAAGIRTPVGSSTPTTMNALTASWTRSVPPLKASIRHRVRLRLRGCAIVPASSRPSLVLAPRNS